MVASAVFVMDFKGKIIISRSYRGDVPTSVAEVFARKIADADETELKPIFTVDGITYVYIKVGGSARCFTISTSDPSTRSTTGYIC